MTVLSNSEVQRILDDVREEMWGLIGRDHRYDQVLGELARVLYRRAGNPHLSEVEEMQIHWVERLGSKHLLPLAEIEGASARTGDLWLLHQQVFQARMQMLKHLIAHDQVIVAGHPLRIAIETRLEADVLPVQSYGHAPLDSQTPTFVYYRSVALPHS